MGRGSSGNRGVGVISDSPPPSPRPQVRHDSSLPTSWVWACETEYEILSRMTDVGCDFSVVGQCSLKETYNLNVPANPKRDRKLQSPVKSSLYIYIQNIFLGLGHSSMGVATVAVPSTLRHCPHSDPREPTEPRGVRPPYLPLLYVSDPGFPSLPPEMVSPVPRLSPLRPSRPVGEPVSHRCTRHREFSVPSFWSSFPPLSPVGGPLVTVGRTPLQSLGQHPGGAPDGTALLETRIRRDVKGIPESFLRRRWRGYTLRG